MDNRLFHRYATDCSVAFTLHHEQCQGVLADVCVGGAFIACHAFPELNERLSLAVHRGESSSVMTLDALVVRLVGDDEGEQCGFGVRLIQVSTQAAEDELIEFLESVFGLKKPIVRNSHVPGGDEILRTYRFPKVHMSDAERDWMSRRPGFSRSSDGGASITETLTDETYDSDSLPPLGGTVSNGQSSDSSGVLDRVVTGIHDMRNRIRELGQDGKE